MTEIQAIFFTILLLAVHFTVSVMLLMKLINRVVNILLTAIHRVERLQLGINPYTKESHPNEQDR